MATNRAVAYYRVSTDRQSKGGTGLGLAAQNAAVKAHLTSNSLDLVGEFTEVESGRQNDRPKLAEAVAMAKRQKAVLVIAKLDRLARSVATIANLLEAGVEFVACDQPHANRLTIHLLSAVAEHEATMISARTKAALAAAKERGRVLGNPTNLRQAGEVGRQRLIERADQHAQKVLPMLQHLVKTAGITSVHAAADALNQRGVKTMRGCEWYGASVLNLIKRSGFQSIGAMAATT